MLMEEMSKNKKGRKGYRDSPVHFPLYSANAPDSSICRTGGSLAEEHPVSVHTSSDGHFTTSQSNPLPIWTAGKCCPASFPLLVTAPTSLGELLLLHAVWFWQDTVWCAAPWPVCSHRQSLPFPCPTRHCREEGADPKALHP